MAKKNSANGGKQSAMAAKIYDPEVLDIATGEERDYIFKIINENNTYLKGSLRNVNIFQRRPPQVSIPAVCRVRYFFSEQEIEEAKKDGRSLPASTILTAYYKNGQAGYIEDLDYVSDPKEFMKECEPILFAADPSYDPSFTPILVVRPDQQELLWYLRTCSYNQGSPNRSQEHVAKFYEFKPAEIAKTQSTNAKKAVKAQSRFIEGLESEDKNVRDAVWTQHLAIAYSFGVDIFANPQEVERMILWLLEKNTEAFVKASQNPANYMIFVLRMAERAEIISLDRNSNTFRWTNNRNVIATFAAGSDGFAELAKFLQKEDNEATYAKIKTLWEEHTSKGFANYNSLGLSPTID